MRYRSILVITLLLLLPTLANAKEDWDFKLSPYAWFAGVEGDVSTLPNAPIAPIEVTSSQALSDSEASFMLLFEAKTQRHGLLLDVLYTDSRSEENLVEEIGLKLKSISKNKIFSTAYMYELYKKDHTVMDLFAGVRYWKVDTELEFSGGLGLLAGQRIRDAESWYDPLIGIKARTPIAASKFFVAGGLAGGGFGVGSDSFYDVSAHVGYQWNKPIGTTLGYRLFSVDYEDGTFVYDIKQDGWLLGLTWAF